MNINLVINELGIRMETRWVDRNPYMPSMRRNFKCTLKRRGRQMTTYFSQGSAHTKEPTAEDVLGCLLLDALILENTDFNFKLWCDELGFDEEETHPQRVFVAIRKNTIKLEKFLGLASEELLYRGEQS